MVARRKKRPAPASRNGGSAPGAPETEELLAQVGEIIAALSQGSIGGQSSPTSQRKTLTHFFYVSSGVASWRPTSDIVIVQVILSQKVQVCVSTNSTYTSTSPGSVTQQLDDVIYWNNETVGTPAAPFMRRFIPIGTPIYVAVGSGGGVHIVYEVDIQTA